MISQICLQAIFDAIKVYNVRQGKKYLIGYRANSNKPFEFCEIILKKENFWHLVGTVISHNKTLDKNLLFEKCLVEDDKCILQLRGVRPFLSDKYDVTKHPLYQETGEYDSRNNLDIEKYLKQGIKFKKGEVFDVVMI